jgi:hypothetical protein
MKMLHPLALPQRLTALGVAKPQEIVGCTDEEIARVQSASGLRLPEAYVAFLRVAGKGAGRFLTDVDLYYDKIMSLNVKAAEKLHLWEGNKLRLPEKAFVFAMRYGEQFMFFLADGKQSDPPIYLYLEGAGTFKQVANSFWEIIEGELLDLERFRTTHPDAPYWRQSDS